ncbi:MAG TPA: D-alanyl-D-alanine carboxypeptidase family protein, partial [Oscillospiraceae bacterium]|nr:D-alanyl-D-alanine carboxypeptidase family protein [Oscillospiraceae bacterium]
MKYFRTAGVSSRRPLRKAALCLCAALLFSLCARADAPAVSAKSAILVDAASGRVLFAQDVDTRRPVASTTKFMTCLLALEHASLDETVTVSARAAGTEGSSMYLKAGEELTMEALLYGLMLASGNDAAEAVAEHVSGSQDAFVALMNEKAAALGMKNTHFTDPSGLSEDAYSTASDMSLLVMAALRNKELCKIISTKTISVGTRDLTNHNKLLWSEGGFFGGKTGYTKQAGRCLVSCAEQNGQRLVVVTLNDPNDWSDHAALQAYGFA